MKNQKKQNKPNREPKGEIVTVISEWKHHPTGVNAIKPGYKRVEAIVRVSSGLITRHIDIKK